MRKIVLLFAAWLPVAAGNSATAQNEVLRLQAGQAFTLHSKVEAVGTGLPPKYQWYRDGSPIEGATSPVYTIPAGQAVGSNVEFKRAAYTDGCAERMFTNTITITWCNLKLGETCWADANVTQPGTFAARPDMLTEFYQWSLPNVAWHPTDPGNDVAISGWHTSLTAPVWTATPCPEGWRLPTQAEIDALHNLPGNVSSRSGYWAAANTRGNAVAGRFYSATAALGQSGCSLPGTMVGCIFLPAVGDRYATNGALTSAMSSGGYWSSTQDAADNLRAYRLAFSSSTSTTNSSTKSFGRSVRCVQ